MTPKQKRALDIWEAALERVREEGRFEHTNIGPVRGWSGNDLSITLRTPFQRLPPIPNEIRRLAASMGKRIENLPYGVDIWDEQKRQKVFNLEWTTKAIFYS